MHIITESFVHFIYLVGCKTVKRSRKLWWLKCTLIITWGGHIDCIENTSKILHSLEIRAWILQMIFSIYLDFSRFILGFFYGCSASIKLEYVLFIYSTVAELQQVQ